VTARPPCRRSADDTLRFAQNSPAHAGEVARRHHNSLSRQHHSVSSDRRGRLVPLHPDDHLARALAGGSSPHRSGPSRPWSPWGTPPSVDDTGGCRASYARCSRPTVRHRWIDRRSWRLPPRGYAVARGGRPGPAAAQAGPGAVRGHHARPDGARQPVAGAGGRRPSRVGGLLELPLSSCSGPPTVVDCSAAPRRAHCTSTATAG
jgi:hypothetical protein